MSRETKAAGVPELSHMKLMDESLLITYTESLKMLLTFLHLIPTLDIYSKELVLHREENCSFFVIRNR